jgi:hypothetical protein
VTAICCPADVPCAGHKLTKADLIEQLQQARAELESARELLAAIAEAADMPSPNKASEFEQHRIAMLSRLMAIHVYADFSTGVSLRTKTQLMHETADRPLPYEPYQEKPELAEAAADV